MRFVCASCGKSAESARRARFCSAACREEATRRRQKEAYHARAKSCVTCALPIPPRAGRSLFCCADCAEEERANRQARAAVLATPKTHAALCSCEKCAECKISVLMFADAVDFASRRTAGDVS